MSENKVAKWESTSVSYKPIGGDESMELTVGYVKKYLAHKTKSGHQPSDSDVIKFMQLCKSQRLNPWVGDAYLLGYDSKDGPTFTLITAVQALLKRAELNPDFDGICSGIIALADDDLVERKGAFLHPGDKLLGGWASVTRKNCSTPFEAKVQLATYDTSRSRWSKDKAGMIEKVARSAALRTAFPSDLGSLYTQEEMDHVIIDGSVNGNGRRSETPNELLKRILNENQETIVDDGDVIDSKTGEVLQESPPTQKSTQKATLDELSEKLSLVSDPEMVEEVQSLFYERFDSDAYRKKVIDLAKARYHEIVEGAEA